MSRYTRQSGFTIVELLIALGLGLFLSAGIVALYIQSKNTFWQDEELARLQENGRYALQLLLRESRMAGFVGGVENPENINKTPMLAVGNDCGADWGLDVAIPLEIVDSAAADLSGTYDCFATDIVANTDVIAVKRVLDRPVIDNGVWADGYNALVDDRIYLRTNNRGLGVALFGKGSDAAFDTGLGGGIVALDPDAVKADPTLGTLVNIWEYQVSLFHIADNVQGIPSLARYTLEADGDISDREILVEGIDDMQFELGIDDDGDGQPERFVAAATNPPDAGANAQDLNDIAAIKIYLLARSMQTASNVPARAMTYKLGTKTVATNDNVMRRVFSGTALLRNPVYVLD